MKANELRIGNWLHYSDFRDVRPDLRDKDFQVIPDDIVYLSEYPDIDWIVPIPLTEEWLLKFGFERKELYSWKGNGCDWQPEISKTEQMDYLLNNFFARFEKWCYRKTENDEWICDNSVQMFRGTWYNQSYEDRIPCEQISYVHQFQNLYFALTNEELEITAP